MIGRALTYSTDIEPGPAPTGAAHDTRPTERTDP